jgi:hypothetical protein
MSHTAGDLGWAWTEMGWLPVVPVGVGLAEAQRRATAAPPHPVVTLVSRGVVSCRVTCAACGAVLGELDATAATAAAAVARAWVAHTCPEPAA